MNRKIYKSSTIMVEVLIKLSFVIGVWTLIEGVLKWDKLGFISFYDLFIMLLFIFLGILLLISIILFVNY